jgi:hypothetical protein
MTRRAIAGKQELTPPPARLDQRCNLSPCSPHGPYEFWAKEINFTSFGPQGHAATPKNRQRPEEQVKRLCNKKPGKCRAFQFSVTSDC